VLEIQSFIAAVAAADPKWKSPASIDDDVTLEHHLPLLNPIAAHHQQLNDADKQLQIDVVQVVDVVVVLHVAVVVVGDGLL
jgi:hypothetical protein